MSSSGGEFEEKEIIVEDSHRLKNSAMESATRTKQALQQAISNFSQVASRQSAMTRASTLHLLISALRHIPGAP